MTSDLDHPGLGFDRRLADVHMINCGNDGAQQFLFGSHFHLIFFFADYRDPSTLFGGMQSRFSGRAYWDFLLKLKYDIKYTEPVFEKETSLDAALLLCCYLSLKPRSSDLKPVPCDALSVSHITQALVWQLCINCHGFLRCWPCKTRIHQRSHQNRECREKP